MVDLYSRVLSLARTPDRLTKFYNRNPHIAAEWQVAVDGRRVDRSAYPTLRHSPGALGCLLSHMQFWRDVVETNQSMTIFEDDAIIHRSFVHEADACLQRLPSDWMFCAWGFNFDAILMCDMIPGCPCAIQNEQGLLRQNVGRFQAADIVPNPMKLYRSFGTVAYALSPLGAKFLLEQETFTQDVRFTFPDMNQRLILDNVGVDIALNVFYPTIKAFVAMPPLVITTQDESTIIELPPPSMGKLSFVRE